MSFFEILPPSVLFFALGFAAAALRSDLSVPDALAKTLSLYLMMAIGLKGGIAIAQPGASVGLVPALLVGSVEKEWLTVSPYAIKFWDKLNLEPYSRQKNVAYLVLVPDFDSEIFDNFSMGASGRGLNASSEEKDYINYFLRYLKKL